MKHYEAGLSLAGCWGHNIVPKQTPHPSHVEMIRQQASPWSLAHQLLPGPLSPSCVLQSVLRVLHDCSLKPHWTNSSLRGRFPIHLWCTLILSPLCTVNHMTVPSRNPTFHSTMPTSSVTLLITFSIFWLLLQSCSELIVYNNDLQSSFH